MENRPNYQKAGTQTLISPRPSETQAVVNNLLRSLIVTLLSVLTIDGFAHSPHTESEINSIEFEGVEMSDDNSIHVFYTVSFDSPLRIGEKFYCFITPIDIEGKPFPDGNKSFLTSGGLYNVTQQGSVSLTIDMPVSYIRRIAGTDEYHIKVSVMSETDDEFFLEDSYAFSYSNLKNAVNASAMQASLGLLDLLFGGADSDSGTFKQSEKKDCDRCYGTGVCPSCNGDGTACPACSSTGRCGKCNGCGYIYVN